jgi:hypothetical protein
LEIGSVLLGVREADHVGYLSGADLIGSGKKNRSSGGWPRPSAESVWGRAHSFARSPRSEASRAREFWPSGSAHLLENRPCLPIAGSSPADIDRDRFPVSSAGQIRSGIEIKKKKLCHPRAPEDGERLPSGDRWLARSRQRAGPQT